MSPNDQLRVDPGSETDESDYNIPKHVSTEDGLPDTIDGQPVKKNKALVKAEKASLNDKAPAKLVELVCKPALGNPTFRNNNKEKNLVFILLVLLCLYSFNSILILYRFLTELYSPKRSRSHCPSVPCRSAYVR